MIAVRSWITSVIFAPVFGLTLVLFQPILMLLHRIAGKTPFLHALTAMNWMLVNELKLCGIKCIYTPPPPEIFSSATPVIIVSNHQSMFDVPLIIRYLHALEPKFIAKRELAHGYPSISYSLRTMGSAIIDRGDPKRAIQVIEEFATRLQATNGCGCIFPEGTRSKDGVLKPFKTNGLLAMLRNMPDAIVLPVAIDGAWKIVEHKLFPVPWGTTIRFTVLPALMARAYSPEELVNKVSAAIASQLKDNAL